MRKLWITLSAIVAAVFLVVLAIPFTMGVWVEKRYPQVIHQFNTPHVSFELINFKRGWFHSHAEVQITFHSAETTLSGEAIPLAQFTITQNIQHGLLVRQTAADGSRHLIVARAAMQNESRADNLNFKATTLWTMANNLNTQLNIQHLLLGNDRQRIEITQLNGNINFTPADKQFQSQLSLGSGALYESNPEKVGNDIIDLVKVMELDNLVTRLDIHKVEALWFGARHFEAQKIMIFPYAGEALTIGNFSADLNQNQHDGLTDFNFTNRIDSINSGQFKIGQVQVGLTLKDMNTPLLENFAHNFMYGADFQRIKLYSLLVDLFTKGMTINLNQMQFTTDDGPVAVQAQITSPTTDAANSGFLHLMENLNVQASANVPKEWLKKSLVSYYATKKSENPHLKIQPDSLAQQYLDHWTSHHLLIPQDKQVTMAVNYKEGQLLINGEKPALDNFIFNESLSGAQ